MNIQIKRTVCPLRNRITIKPADCDTICKKKCRNYLLIKYFTGIKEKSDKERQENNERN